LQRGAITAAGTKCPYTYTNGLVNCHAYALHGVYTLSNGVRLVKLSNPWGYDAYTGDYSDGSSLWTSTLRAEVSSVQDVNDGTFFMPFNTFVSTWDSLFITENGTNWYKNFWLNAGRDVSSSTYGTATFCSSTTCRRNKFDLRSTVDQ
jgi:Calpain family cysteine protease